jgi:UDP-glucuronate decarboxylase
LNKPNKPNNPINPINSQPNKQILVTGGAGFVGGNLCGRLLEMGFYVICVDNLYSGKFENIEKFIKNPDFLFINKDVRDFIDLECDWIFNLACPASPVKYQSDAVFTFMTNVMGAFNMLELAKKNNARIFQASTSEVYGNPGVHPQCEAYFGNVNTIGVRSCYNEGKRGAETLFYDYNRKYGVDIRVARIFNTYGPGMYPEDGRIISNFIYQALNNSDLTVYGDGSHTRWKVIIFILSILEIL